MVLLFESAFMLLSAIISYANGIDGGFAPLLLSFLFTALLGTLLHFLFDWTGGSNLAALFCRCVNCREMLGDPCVGIKAVYNVKALCKRGSHLGKIRCASAADN